MVFIILFAVLIYCVLEYKSEVVRNHTSRVRYTLMATHKENGEAVLSGEHPELSEDFICRVPQLQKIQIEGITSPDGRVFGKMALGSYSRVYPADLYFQYKSAMQVIAT